MYICCVSIETEVFLGGKSKPTSSFGMEMRDHRRSELEVFEAKPSIDLFRQWKQSKNSIMHGSLD